MMAFCESQWFGMGGATSTTSSSSDVMWMGSNTANITSTLFTGVNCWTTDGSSDWGGGGGGTCTATEYYNAQMQMQIQAQYQQMMMQTQQIYATQGLATQHQMSDEERRNQQAQAEALQQARLEQCKLQTEAGNKAKELLLEHLTPAQKETFNKNKWFVVEGGRSKQQYRIMAERCSINIEVMDGKKVSHKLCAHLGHDIPLHDHILAQKIMLESAEDDFLKIANRHAA